MGYIRSSFCAFAHRGRAGRASLRRGRFELGRSWAAQYEKMKARPPFPIAGYMYEPMVSLASDVVPTGATLCVDRVAGLQVEARISRSGTRQCVRFAHAPRALSVQRYGRAGRMTGKGVYVAPHKLGRIHEVQEAGDLDRAANIAREFFPVALAIQSQQRISEALEAKTQPLNKRAEAYLAGGGFAEEGKKTMFKKAGIINLLIFAELVKDKRCELLKQVVELVKRPRLR